MGMTVDELVNVYPQLYHMATSGAWPSIQKHGLRTTCDLVETSGLPIADQDALLRVRRPKSTVIDHPEYGKITIRDQAPLREDNLAACLSDMTVVEWLQTLNDRVFFWLHPDRLSKLLNARLYRGREHDVLVVDTRSLVETYYDRIRLSPVNSGATIFPNPATRGSTTFQPIEQYPFSERRKGRTLANAVTELAVLGGVSDLAEHVTRVDRFVGPQSVALLFPLV
jgi:hypothetical protein